jgi:hypothetical protein
MNDPMKMLKQVQQMQDRMAKAQRELEKETVEATAGGGAVRVVVTGAQKVVSVHVDPAAAEDVEMLQDLVLAATNEALDRSRELQARKMKSVTSDLRLPPGLLQ